MDKLYDILISNITTEYGDPRRTREAERLHLYDTFRMNKLTQKYGNIQNIRIPFEKFNGTEKHYYGFLSMANPASHEQLLNDLQHTIIRFGRNELFFSKATTYREPIVNKWKSVEENNKSMEGTLRNKRRRTVDEEVIEIKQEVKEEDEEDIEEYEQRMEEKEKEIKKIEKKLLRREEELEEKFKRLNTWETVLKEQRVEESKEFEMFKKKRNEDKD